tara:strand:+ start:170 stop:337 length:168 start_codon:yes stop_codon:yes gene_type:complete
MLEGDIVEDKKRIEDLIRVEGQILLEKLIRLEGQIRLEDKGLIQVNKLDLPQENL